MRIRLAVLACCLLVPVRAGPERCRNVVRGHEHADGSGRHGHRVAARRQGRVRAARARRLRRRHRPSTPRVPEFCRTALTLTPSSDSDIKVEVWLPASGWNGKFQAVGNGGFAGVVPYAGHGARGAGRLRDGGHRYRPRRQHRRVRPRPSRESGGLRLSRHPRDDGGRQARHRRALRPRTAVLVLQRLLTGRPPGHHQRAALSGRLRRHRRRRGGLGSDAQPRRAAGAEPDDEPLAGGGDSAAASTR